MRPAWRRDPYLVVAFETQWLRWKPRGANFALNTNFVWKCGLSQRRMLGSDWAPRFAPWILTIEWFIKDQWFYKRPMVFRRQDTRHSSIFTPTSVYPHQFKGSEVFFLTLQSFKLFIHLLQRSSLPPWRPGRHLPNLTHLHRIQERSPS